MSRAHSIPGYTRRQIGKVSALVKEYENGAQLAQQIRRDPLEVSTWRYGRHTPEETARGVELGAMTPSVLAIADETRGGLETAMRAHDMTGISAKRRRVWSDSGDTPDPDRILANHERPWTDSRRGKPGRVVRLGLNFWLSCGNSEEDFARIVGVTCAAVDVLNSLGFGTEVVVFAAAPHTDGSGLWMVAHWTAKRSDEHLDLGRIGCVGMPGALRAGIFAEWQTIDSGCGSGSHQIDEIRPLLNVDHIIGRRWSEMTQKDVYEGIVSMLATHQQTANA